MTAVAYSGPMTDQWPLVRLGMGGRETGTLVSRIDRAGRVRGTRLRRVDPAGRSLASSPAPC